MAKLKCNTKAIPAVTYCRKSTNEADAEKSIVDQLSRICKLKPTENNAEYKIARTYIKDKGVPGWKRGAQRPDYFRMVNELNETKAKAILVDDMDRFSRADPMETIADVQALRELGVRFIHAVNQGSKDLVEGGPIIGSCPFSEKLALHDLAKLIRLQPLDRVRLRSLG